MLHSYYLSLLAPLPHSNSDFLLFSSVFLFFCIPLSLTSHCLYIFSLVLISLLSMSSSFPSEWESVFPERSVCWLFLNIWWSQMATDSRLRSEMNCSRHLEVKSWDVISFQISYWCASSHLSGCQGLCKHQVNFQGSWGPVQSLGGTVIHLPGSLYTLHLLSCSGTNHTTEHPAQAPCARDSTARDWTCTC